MATHIEKPNLALNGWRNRITKSLWVIAILIAVVEILVLFVIEQIDPWVTPHGPQKYLIFYFLIPSLFDFSAVLTNSFVQKSPLLTEKQKNYGLAVSASVIALVVAFTHYDVLPSMSAFSFPIILTVLFADIKTTRSIALLNFSFLTICLFRSGILSTHNLFYIDVLTANLSLFCTYLLSKILIDYIKKSSDYICASYKTQLALNERAKRDPLTELYNQKTFFSKLDTSVQKALETRTPLSIAILDIDDFKLINDTYGHSAGNEVLTTISKMMLQQFFEESTFVARYGGEEFGIIFDNTNKQQAFEQMERLRKRLEKSRYESVENTHITASIGVVQYTKEEKGKDLFDRADAALYQAKALGKNQTVVE